MTCLELERTGLVTPIVSGSWTGKGEQMHHFWLFTNMAPIMAYVSITLQHYRQMGKSPLQLSITSKILDKTMSYLKLVVSNFIKQEDGPTAVEYAIMLALIVVVCIAAVSSIGQSARGVFEAVANVF